MKNYLLVFVLLVSTSHLFITSSDDAPSKPFCSTMKAPLYPLEQPWGAYNNVRPVVDKIVRKGKTMLLTDCDFERESDFFWDKQGRCNLKLKSGCFLSTKKEGDVEVVVASKIEDGVTQAAHLILCTEIKETSSFDQSKWKIKQATVVATTYSGFNCENRQDETHSRNLLIAAARELKMRGYYNLSNSCGRLETDHVFNASGFGNRIQSFLFVQDKTRQLFNPSYCQELTCSKLACAEHTK